MKKPAFVFLTGILLLITTVGCKANPGTNASETTTYMLPPDQQLVQITSLSAPYKPGETVNPGGPKVEITVKNVAAQPIVSLTATLELRRSHEFTFGVTASNPLLPGQSVSRQNILIGEGFGSGLTYPVTIDATLKNGARSVYTQQVQSQ